MNVLVYRTNIRYDHINSLIRPLLDNQKSVFKWTVDMDDIDHVLRVEAHDQIEEEDIAQIIRANGVQCESLDG